MEGGGMCGRRAEECPGKVLRRASSTHDDGEAGVGTPLACNTRTRALAYAYNIGVRVRVHACSICVMRVHVHDLHLPLSVLLLTEASLRPMRATISSGCIPSIRASAEFTTARLPGGGDGGGSVPEGLFRERVGGRRRVEGGGARGLFREWAHRLDVGGDPGRRRVRAHPSRGGTRAEGGQVCPALCHGRPDSAFESVAFVPLGRWRVRLSLGPGGLGGAHAWGVGKRVGEMEEGGGGGGGI